MPRKKSSTDITLAHKPETVRKNVAAIHTSGDLSLLERKTANVLLLNAYPHLLTRRTHTLPVSMMCAMLGYDSNDIDRLKEVLRRLASTTIEFNVMKDGKESWKVMSMLSFGSIEGGVCTYRYDEYLAERLYDPEIYATINLAIIRRFESSYALTLYENCLRYKNVGSTGWWEIERFRNIMGATASMYDEFKYLKREVVSKPVDQVNKVSDIRLTPEFQKTGRKVSAVRFSIEPSVQQTLMKPEDTDEFVELRSKEAFKRLIDHGIGEPLALLWVRENEQQVLSIIEYVEAKDKKNQIKGSTAGYIRKLIEDKADVHEVPAYQEKKKQVASTRTRASADEKKTAELAELQDEFQKGRVTALLLSLIHI